MLEEHHIELLKKITLLDFTRQREENLMARRSKMRKKRSKNLFSKTASKTHRRNNSSRPMRGGIRL